MNVYCFIAICDTFNFFFIFYLFRRSSFFISWSLCWQWNISIILKSHLNLWHLLPKCLVLYLTEFIIIHNYIFALLCSCKCAYKFWQIACQFALDDFAIISFLVCRNCYANFNGFMFSVSVSTQIVTNYNAFIWLKWPKSVCFVIRTI